jgi:2,6-dihydroxypseudooxynicotine hydrolase
MARDESVQSALDNWAPRFLANGIDYNDFLRVTDSLERWEDWCQAWAACGATYEAMAQEARTHGYAVSAAEHALRAALCYHFGKYLFVRWPEQLRAAHEHVVRNYQDALPFVQFPGERVAIPYEGGASMYGILRRPWRAVQPPLVILVPGLDSVKEELHFYGNDFLRRGMAVLAIDGPGQGEMEFTHPMRHDYQVPIRYAIDYLEQRGDIDAARVGLMGVSFGGQYAVRAAAFEPRLKAVIENCGPYDQARTFADRPQISRETMVYRLKAASEAEALEKLRFFNLRGVAEHVRCPLLVIQGRRDRLVPAEQGERIAAEAGSRAELWLFEDGRHVCNNIPWKHRPQQADWMAHRLQP